MNLENEAIEREEQFKTIQQNLDNVLQRLQPQGFQSYNEQQPIQAEESKFMQNEQFNDVVIVEIPFYQMKQDSVQKFVVYNIRGKDKNGNFEIPRRYNDFLLFRASLVERLPGFYIPPLPPKKSIGNLENEFIEKRKLYLEKFLKKLSQNSFLWYAAETKVFLHSNFSNATTFFSTLPKITYEEMIANYEANFESIRGVNIRKIIFYEQEQVDLDLTTQIQQFQMFLKRTIPMLQNFKEIYKNLYSARQSHNDQYATFVNLLLPEYERTCLLEYCQGNQKTVFSSVENDQYNEVQQKLSTFFKQNEFLRMYEETDVQLKEIEAFLDSFRQRDQLEHKKTEAQQKLKTYQLEKQEILAGKNTFKQIFDQTPKEEKINKLSVKMEILQKETDQLNILCNLVSLILGKIEIPAFKVEKEKGYFKIIENLAQFELEFAKVQAEYWRGVISNEYIVGAKQYQDQIQPLNQISQKQSEISEIKQNSRKSFKTQYQSQNLQQEKIQQFFSTPQEQPVKKLKSFVFSHKEFIQAKPYEEESKIFQSEVDQKEIQVEIPIYQIMTDSFGKVVKYKIQGQDRNGKFDIQRRYSDFILLRTKLLERWPGYYIPPLPPKQAIGNLDHEFIDTRKTQLEIFLKKLGQSQILWNGVEINIFLRSNDPDIARVFENLQQITYEEILQNYEVNFKSIKLVKKKQLNYEKEKNSLDAKIQIEMFELFLKQTIPMLQNFQDIYKGLNSARQAQSNHYATFVKLLLPEYERTCLLEYCQGTETTIFSNIENNQYNEVQHKLISFLKQNELVQFYNAIVIEKKNCEAFLESFRQREQLENEKKQAQMRLRSYQLEKQEYLAGKNNFVIFINKTSKEEIINKIDIKMKLAQKHFDQLDFLCSQVNFILGKTQIPAFKFEREQGYYKTVMNLAEFELDYTKVLQEYWQEVLQNKHLVTQEEKNFQI